ncbi:murein biosynthesis integral membrane protein MurJ [Litorimonas sp. WD9-15]|uniref:murein biosynthesis integral membrane protein MurJ n=1 Tax=Litorimonas sp. WD9-15 TaxID=3418716 RepID=UPI003D01F91A
MKLLRSTAIIGSLTLVSRLLGLVRDVLIARYLGAGAVSDAFFTAFKLPNVFRRMFAEGAFNAAFVPLYAKRIEREGEEAADNFASEVGSMLLVVVLGLVIAFELTMPWSLNIIGFGLDRTAGADGVVPYDLAVTYALITMPYLLFMSLMALLSGIMNTREKFALPTLALALLNVFMISALFFAPRFGLGQADIGLALSAAVTVSGLAQAGLVWWGCKRAGVRLKLRAPKVTPGVKRLVILGVPGILSAGITQINLLVSHSIATTQASAASWLTYADRLYQLPLGMIGIAMGIALLPSLSRSIRAGDEAGAKTSLNRGIEIAAFLTLPAAVALYVLPEFFIGGIYERGAFTASTTEQVAKALRWFALGLPGFVLLKVLTPAFFARENTRTPMIWAGISAGINISLGVALFMTIGFEGLALATSVAAWVNVAGLFVLLRKNGDLDPDARLLRHLPRILLASLVMGAALWLVLPYLPDMGETHIVMDFVWLGAVAFAGFVIYALAATLLRAYDRADIGRAFSRRS